MKILHIIDHSIPLHDGYAFRSRNIFRSQLKMGLKPVVLTSPKHEEYWKGQWCEREEFDGVVHYRTGSCHHSCIPLASEMEIMLKLYEKILRVVQIEKPDLLHPHSPVLNAVPALIAGKKMNIPVVYEIRAFWEDAGVDQGTYRQGGMKYKLVRGLETWVCRNADQVAVLCEGLKKDLKNRGIFKEKMTSVFNGIDPGEFNPCEPDRTYSEEWNLRGKTVVGFIGSFYRYEGLDFLLRSFARIATKNDNIVSVAGRKWRSHRRTVPHTEAN